MTELDRTDELLDLAWPPPDPATFEREPRKCRRHQWVHHFPAIVGAEQGCERVDGSVQSHYECARCPAVRDEALSRRGRQSRNYGNRAELAVARTYGGEKIGHAGGPVDVRGKDWNTQVKTHRRPPPREWTSAFNAMAANRERLPRLLLRFVMGPGVAPDDYMVIPAKAWLDWFGRDESDSTT